ncbi:MAG: hypothetical protein AAF050_17405, partial [Cyanobacteria bacterium J06649_5]
MLGGLAVARAAEEDATEDERFDKSPDESPDKSPDKSSVDEEKSVMAVPKGNLEEEQSKKAQFEATFDPGCS